MCASIPLAALVVEFHIYSRRAPLLDFHARDGVVAGSVFAGYDQYCSEANTIQST